MVEIEATIISDDKPEKIVKNIMKPRSFEQRREPSEFEERVIEVRRVARTVKGGRRIRFRALVVIGNRKGKVGMGIAKANDVSEAVKKATAQAKKNTVIVPIIDGTIPYEVISKHGAAVVMLKPAATGTSIVAGGSVRAIAELAGITDLLSKMLGSASKVNNIVATMKAFAAFNEGYTDRIKKYSEYKNKPVSSAEIKMEKKIEVAEKNEESAVKKPAKSVAKKTAKKSIKK
jgi:small subunit ribosomal protein S5